MTAQASFEAGHTIQEFHPCARPGHGHHYDVSVSVAGDLDPKTGWPRATEDLPVDLQLLVSELDGESLTDMLPGIATSPLGIAAYIQERLLLRYPKIVEVTVDCSNHTRGTVRRTLRQ